MKKRIRRRFDAHTRADDVCTEHRATYDATRGGQKQRASLGDCTAESKRLVALQKRSMEERKAATAQCRIVRRALRVAIKAVVTFGRLVELPGAVMDTLRMPSAMSDTDLLAYSRGLLDRVSPFAAAFEAEGLPSGILDDLRSGIAMLDAARADRSAAVQNSAAAALRLREVQNRADDPELL